MKRKGSVEPPQPHNSTNIFSLSPLHPKPSNPFHFSFAVHPSTIQSNHHHLLQQHPEPPFLLPRLNIQKSPFTPLFTVHQSEVDSSQSKSVTGESGKNSEREDDRLEERREQAEQIFIAKPSSHYCSVCKLTYTDYLQHIKQDLHRLKVKKSDKDLKFTDLIDSLKKSKERERRRERPLDEERNSFEGRKRKLIMEEMSSFRELKLSRSMSESTCNSEMCGQVN